MTTKQEQFIKDAYNNELDFHVCDDVKKQIKVNFPELFKEAELNKWYITKARCLFCLTNYNGNKNKGYGFDDDVNGKWHNTEGNENHFGYKDDIEREATEEEVFEALKKEAVKRGFVDGVNYKSVKRKLHNGRYSSSKTHTLSRLHLVIYPEHKETTLLNNGMGAVFHNGKWATIIEEQKPKEIVVDGVTYIEKQ